MGDYGRSPRFGVIVNADACGCCEEASALVRRSDEAGLDLVAVFVANERLPDSRGAGDRASPRYSQRQTARARRA